MARFMDSHEDLKLPAKAIAQIAEDTRNARSDRFGVRQIELYHNADGKVYACSKGLLASGELGHAFDLIDTLEPLADIFGFDKKGNAR